MKRDSMLFYRTFLEGLEDFDTIEEKYEWLTGIINYGLNGVEFNPSTKLLKVAWRHVHPLVDANIKNYINGKKGGAPVGNKNAKKQPKNNPKTTKNNRKQGNVDVEVDVDKDKDKEVEEEVEVEVDVDKDNPNPLARAPELSPLDGGTF